MLLASCVFAFAWKQFNFYTLPVPINGYYFDVEHGSSLNKVTQQLHSAGLIKYPRVIRWYAVVFGTANKIQAGEYKIIPGTKVKTLMQMLSTGAVTQYAITVVEGWRFDDLVAELNRHPKIKHTLKDLSSEQILQKLNIPAKSLEGMFLPDTYYFHAWATDEDFLRRAYESLRDKLQFNWEKRSKHSVLKTPYEALILASIIEKESGLIDEYQLISGVYQRRLTKKMRLQADPTIVYFLGDNLKGLLRHKHLKIDSPYNTYLRHGLPPTPIALPSLKAINAALNPAPGEYLYFVARGDGGHIFTKTFAEHSKAIAQVKNSKSN